MISVSNGSVLWNASLHETCCSSIIITGPKSIEKLNHFCLCEHLFVTFFQFCPNSDARIEWRALQRMSEWEKEERWREWREHKLQKKENRKWMHFFARINWEKIYDSCSSVNETIFIIIPRDSSHDEYLWNINGLRFFFCVLFFLHSISSLCIRTHTHTRTQHVARTHAAHEYILIGLIRNSFGNADIWFAREIFIWFDRISTTIKWNYSSSSLIVADENGGGFFSLRFIYVF